MGISLVAPRIIRVMFDRGSVTIDPYSAEVSQGGKVRFEITIRQGLPDVEAEVYFDERSPFRWRAERVRVPAGTAGGGPRWIEATADEPGDFKYGVRAVTAAEGILVADDDPFLTVRASEDTQSGGLTGAPWAGGWTRDPMTL
jgi:hypothetical protein